MTDDPYVYSGTDILRNSFGERDKTRLEERENYFSAKAVDRLLRRPVEGNFDLDHLRRIHSAIFGEIYPEMAGKVRVIKLWKQEIGLSGQSVAYTPPAEIPVRAAQALKELNAGQYGGLIQQYQIEAFGRALAAVWQVHAFREGNTRAISLMAQQFSTQRGFEFDLTVISNAGSDFRDALAVACVLGDLSGLTNILTLARQSALASNHPVLGKLTSEAVEVLKLMPNKDARLAKDGEHIKGTILTTSYQTALVLTSMGIVGVPIKNFAVIPENNARVAIVAEVWHTADPKADLRYAKAMAFQAWREECNILIGLAAKGRETIAAARRIMTDPNATLGEVRSKIGLVNEYAGAISRTWEAAASSRSMVIERTFRQRLPDLPPVEVDAAWAEVKVEFVLPRPVIQYRDFVSAFDHEVRDYFNIKKTKLAPNLDDEDINPHRNYDNVLKP